LLKNSVKLSALRLEEPDLHITEIVTGNFVECWKKLRNLLKVGNIFRDRSWSRYEVGKLWL
jgi:hypothetical protein